MLSSKLEKLPCDSLAKTSCYPAADLPQVRRRLLCLSVLTSSAPSACAQHHKPVLRPSFLQLARSSCSACWGVEEHTLLQAAEWHASALAAEWPASGKVRNF
ncbi:unnamed protein product [Polarella glacialis]|uniref:Uncharacterized protein n=1 Tax=Polarella glacialis TaxID=89957 RepID=A0A813KY58_POLGL|nr:unnamed protein product [Polarella glacialis]